MHEELLEELFSLVEKEFEGVKLTEKEQERYAEIVSLLKRDNVEIPFGIEL